LPQLPSNADVYVKLKDRKRSLSGKKTTTRCAIKETATTRNFVLWLFLNNRNVLWLFLNNRNVLWHVKTCHDAKVVTWLLKEKTTTSSDFMKLPQAVVVFTFYSHDAM